MTQNNFLILFLLLFAGEVNAQSKSSSYNNTGKKYYTSNYGSINANYSIFRTHKKSAFHNYFEDQFNSKFTQESYAIGINYAGPIVVSSNYKSGKHYDSHLGIHQQFTNTFQPNDSTSFRFQAFHFNYAIGKDLLYFWNNVDLPLRLGFDAGMAFLKENSTRNRNPFFNLIGQAEMRFVIWRIVLASKIEIGYDITSKNWKPKKNDINSSLAYKNHYYSLQFSLGYNLFEPIKKAK